MSAPFYVSPDQLMQDRAEFARKGISRGRSVLALSSPAGIALVAENRSDSLHKVAEIYDRIGFLAVGRYNEFEALRVAGIRQADLRGYSYDRRDVTARGLAGQYSQLLGAAFSGAEKPYEVELVVAELGFEAAGDVLFQISYDGSISEHHRFAVLGRDSDGIAARVRAGLDGEGATDLPAAVRLARAALSEDGPLGADALEVAVLERGRGSRRTFHRVTGRQLEEWLVEAQ
ncbi:proteasome subunit alpha [Tessaracoccus rhinocerotis]|uniref:Proteasome subunit alpha n=1 Tax=Tessaracoccus rhinocerotis TaxID=1689449 RepID=A0A553JY10_9ACTN|nr:proteasome subunit alpha [Tessaracoccus rhinocerotis]TRY17333.1 proteasome subunit alpha [Tessaracoccus rhinocerotis]